MEKGNITIQKSTQSGTGGRQRHCFCLKRSAPFVVGQADKPINFFLLSFLINIFLIQVYV